jgi:hypothetical protein
VVFSLKPDEKIDDGIEALYDNKLHFSFAVRASNVKSAKPITVQQAFISLTNAATGSQVVFPAQNTGKGQTVVLVRAEIYHKHANVVVEADPVCIISTMLIAGWLAGWLIDCCSGC